MEIQDAQPLSTVQSPPAPAAEPERPAEAEAPTEAPAPSEAPPLPDTSATILDLYA